MIQPELLERFGGFTEEEVRVFCCAGSGLLFSDVQKWYDGYVLGIDIHIYSPQSVIEAVQRSRIGN